MKRIIALFAVSLALTGIVNAQSIVSSDRTIDRTVPTWRIAVQGGFVYRIGKVDNSLGAEMTEYLESLRKGFCYSADVTHYFSEALGVGVKYSDGRFSGSVLGTATFIDGSTRSGTCSDKIDFRLVGPFLSYRWVSANARNAFYINYGLGYLGMTDDSVVITDSFTMKGGTLGQFSDIGYDFSITKKLALGASVSFIAGTLSSYTIYNSGGSSQSFQLEKDEYESLDHLTFSLGLRLLL